MEAVRFLMPGRVVMQLINSTDWPEQCPDGARSILAGVWHQRGRGRQLEVSMHLDHALDLDDFIDGLMHEFARDGISDLVVWQRTQRRLQEAIERAGA